MMRLPSFVLSIAIVIVLTAAAHAAPRLLDVTVTEESAGRVNGVRVEVEGTREPLVEPVGVPLMTPGEIDTSWRMTPARGGFDIAVTLHNRTGNPHPRPAFRLTGVRLGKKVTCLDAVNLGVLVDKDLTDTPRFRRRPFSYPNATYAPVEVLMDERIAVGVSMMYDVLETRHAVWSLWQLDANGFTFCFDPGPDATMLVGPEKNTKRLLDWQTHLGPGERETFRVAVRFARRERWRDTLSPYRDHFRKTYGKVQYKRDLRPVYAQPLSQSNRIADDNPRGFIPKFRLDKRGWGPVVDLLMEGAVAAGFRRVMLRNAQGYYKVGTNFPTEFMTEWSEAMTDSVDQLARLEKAGVAIGYWWGRSSQVSGGWNTGKMWQRDIRKAADVAAGYEELRLAAARRADEIGLDAFGFIPVWDRVTWLKRIRKDFPGMRFITESAQCDILHAMAPTYTILKKQTGPPLLADYILPGHETWISMRRASGDREQFERLVEWKVVPVCFYPQKHDASSFEQPE